MTHDLMQNPYTFNNKFTGREIIPILNMLDSIYFDKNIGTPILQVEIDRLGAVIFKEEGFLDKIKYEGVFDYHVNGANLEATLFNNHNKEIKIIITYLCSSEVKT